MESLLEDIPVNKAQEGFAPFIEKTTEIQEPEEEENSNIVETPENPAEEEASLVEPVEELPQTEEPEAEFSEEAPEASSETTVQPVDEEVPDQEQTSEVVFEQVEGPKVEVLSVKDEVQKIIVHLAPDKILEIDCEY